MFCVRKKINQTFVYQRRHRHRSFSIVPVCEPISNYCIIECVFSRPKKIDDSLRDFVRLTVEVHPVLLPTGKFSSNTYAVAECECSMSTSINCSSTFDGKMNILSDIKFHHQIFGHEIAYTRIRCVVESECLSHFGLAVCRARARICLVSRTYHTAMGPFGVCSENQLS